MQTDPIGVAVRAIAILERLEIPCAVGGAIASALAGEPRATEDVDIVADIRAEHLDTLAAALEDEFYTLDPARACPDPNVVS